MKNKYIAINKNDMNSYISLTVRALICIGHVMLVFYLMMSIVHPQDNKCCFPARICVFNLIMSISFTLLFRWVSALLCWTIFFYLCLQCYTYILLMSTEVVLPNQRKTTNNSLIFCWIKVSSWHKNN